MALCNLLYLYNNPNVYCSLSYSLYSCVQVRFINSDGTDNLNPCPPFRIKFPTTLEGKLFTQPGNETATKSLEDSSGKDGDHSDKVELLVEAYIPPDPGPYPQDQPKQNSVRFTPTQVHEYIILACWLSDLFS